MKQFIHSLPDYQLQDRKPEWKNAPVLEFTNGRFVVMMWISATKILLIRRENIRGIISQFFESKIGGFRKSGTRFTITLP
jgi:hypothetical protein